MQLRYISIALLVAEAGGDPRATNASLQVGRPAQISDLARAFHDAGQSTQEAEAAFAQARQRFGASWNGESGEQPINNSAEVRRVTKSLCLQAIQLPKIAVDLENIAAALAEAQRAAGWYTAALEQDLEDIDGEICEALADDDQDEAADLCEVAVAETRAMLFQLEHIRDSYSAALQTALGSLRSDGANPAELKGADELLIPPHDTSPEQVKRWWDSLSDEQKRLLADQHAQELGNLNGVPAEVRNSVNQEVMNDDLRRVEDAARQRGLSPATLRSDVLQTGMTTCSVTPESTGFPPPTSPGIRTRCGPTKASSTTKEPTQIARDPPCCGHTTRWHSMARAGRRSRSATRTRRGTPRSSCPAPTVA